MFVVCLWSCSVSQNVLVLRSHRQPHVKIWMIQNLINRLLQSGPTTYFLLFYFFFTKAWIKINLQPSGLQKWPKCKTVKVFLLSSEQDIQAITVELLGRKPKKKTKQNQKKPVRDSRETNHRKEKRRIKRFPTSSPLTRSHLLTVVTEESELPRITAVFVGDVRFICQNCNCRVLRLKQIMKV